MFRISWRPLDGWRRFFGEVGIIILGVLVALGLGAIATEIAWRTDVRQSRDALSYELGEAIGQGRERVNVAPCIEGRLDQLARIVSDAKRDGRLPPLGDIKQPPWRTWNSGIWDSAVAARTASHFPRKEAIGLVSFYEFVGMLRTVNARELDAWTRLHTLVGPGRRFGPEVAARMHAAIGEARFLHRFMALSSIRADQIASAYTLRHDDRTAREYSDKPLSAAQICGPISPQAASAYGQAPFNNIIERAKSSPTSGLSGGN